MLCHFSHLTFRSKRQVERQTARLRNQPRIADQAVAVSCVFIEEDDSVHDMAWLAQHQLKNEKQLTKDGPTGRDVAPQRDHIVKELETRPSQVPMF